MKFLGKIGIISILTGWILLTFWGILHGVLESKSLLISVTIVVIWIGVLILLITTLVQRIKELKTDPYKDVEV